MVRTSSTLVRTARSESSLCTRALRRPIIEHVILLVVVSRMPSGIIQPCGLRVVFQQPLKVCSLETQLAASQTPPRPEDAAIPDSTGEGYNKECEFLPS